MGNCLALGTIHDLKEEFASQNDEEENMETVKMPDQGRLKGLKTRTLHNKN